MKISDAFPSKYLKANDLSGQSTIATISGVSIEALGLDKERKPVLYFRDLEKGLVLNKTNAEAIALFTGEDDMEAWKGSMIGLYATPVQFQGKIIDSIRVSRPPKPAPAAEHAASEPREGDVGPEDGIPFE